MRLHADPAGPGGLLLVREVLEPELLAALQLYVRAQLASGGLRWEDWGQRHVRNDDPIVGLVHRALVPAVEALLQRAVKPSYSFLACYGEGGGVPPHLDREQCRYTLDLCLEDAGGGGPWPLWVEGRPIAFTTNQALLYFGCEQTHHREPKPAGKTAHLAFLHYVDADFAGSLQ